MYKVLFSANWKRRCTQFVSLVLLGEWSFYGIFRCPFAIPYIGCGQCPVVQCPGRSLWMWSWMVLAVTALFFGRFFCGWACPGGLVAEMLAILTPIRIRVGAAMTRYTVWLKYILLGLVFIFFFLLNNPRWAIPIRTGEFFSAVALTFEHAGMLWLIKTAGILVFFFLGGLVVPRLWCRFLCPTGGLLDLFHRFAQVKIVADGHCQDCDSCHDACVMGSQPGEKNCINCGDCRPVCPAGSIHYSHLPRR